MLIQIKRWFPFNIRVSFQRSLEILFIDVEISENE